MSELWPDGLARCARRRPREREELHRFRRDIMHDWYQRCLNAYQEHCQKTEALETEHEQQAWIDEWRALEADDHEDAVENYLAEQRRYFKEGV